MFSYIHLFSPFSPTFTYCHTRLHLQLRIWQAQVWKMEPRYFLQVPTRPEQQSSFKTSILLSMICLHIWPLLNRVRMVSRRSVEGVWSVSAGCQEGSGMCLEVEPKLLGLPIIFWTEKFFWTQNYSDTKFSRHQIFQALNTSDQQFFEPRYSQTKNFSRQIF